MLKFFLVIAIFAAVTYLTIRAIERRGLTPSPRATPPQRQRPPKMVAPDDDEEFLRDLDRKRRHPDDPEDPTPA